MATWALDQDLADETNNKHISTVSCQRFSHSCKLLTVTWTTLLHDDHHSLACKWASDNHRNPVSILNWYIINLLASFGKVTSPRSQENSAFTNHSPICDAVHQFIKSLHWIFIIFPLISSSFFNFSLFQKNWSILPLKDLELILMILMILVMILNH